MEKCGIKLKINLKFFSSVDNLDMGWRSEETWDKTNLVENGKQRKWTANETRENTNV